MIAHDRVLRGALDAITGRMEGAGPFNFYRSHDSDMFVVFCERCDHVITSVPTEDLVAWRKSEKAFLAGAKAYLIPAITDHWRFCGQPPAWAPPPGDPQSPYTTWEPQPPYPPPPTVHVVTPPLAGQTFKRRFGTEAP